MKAYNNKSIRFSRIKGQLNWGVNLTRYWGRSEVFRYLGVDKVANETKEVELTHGLGDGANFLGALKNGKTGSLSGRAKIGVLTL